MVARLVPDGEDGVSAAESLVLRALRDQLPDGTTVLVNLRLTDESGDREADAVVVWPGVGVAVVEVKGGHVAYADGHWWLGERRRPRRVDPVRQALDCKYRIRGVLRRHPRWSGGDPRMVHHVVLPFTRLPETFAVAECPRELVTDQNQIGSLAERLRTQLDNLQPAPEPLGPAHASSLIAALTGPQRPQIDLVARVAAEVDERAMACELLTARQARVLDLLRLQQRVQVLGGAGTGKTWLAVEQARRLAADGLRVALLCYSRGLARWLRRRGGPAPWTGTYHSLGVRWGARPREHAPQSFYQTEVSAVALLGQEFASVVLDENRRNTEPIAQALATPPGRWCRVVAKGPGCGGCRPRSRTRWRRPTHRCSGCSMRAGRRSTSWCSPPAAGILSNSRAWSTPGRRGTGSRSGTPGTCSTATCSAPRAWSARRWCWPWTAFGRPTGRAGAALRRHEPSATFSSSAGHVERRRVRVV